MLFRVFAASSIAPAAVLAAVLTGCAPSQSPAQVCASRETADHVQNLLIQAALESKGKAITSDLTGKLRNGDQLISALQKLFKTGIIKLELVSLKGFDTETKAVSCEGNLMIRLPAALTTGGLMFGGEAFHGGDTADLAIQFGRKPTADGKELIFSVSRDADNEDTLLGVGALQAILDATSSALTATPAPPSPEDAALAEIPTRPADPLQFSAYAATPYTGPVTPPDFDGPQRPFAQFKTRLLDAVKGGVNFAGNYAVAELGCGTGCRDADLVDLQTGKVFAFPVGGEDFSMLQLTYHPDSKLVLAMWQASEGDGGKTFCVHEALIWAGDQFTQMPKTKTEGDCPFPE